jgi:FkbM family methyltransferase
MHVSWRKWLSRTIRGRIRARILSNYGEGIVANTRNGVLIVDPRDFNVSRSLLRHGSYDWAEVEWLGRLLNEHSQIVFVGAHIGALLVPIALRSGSRKILAFEPSPHNHRLLSRNVALNGLQSISVQRLAAGDFEGMVRFVENRINSGNSRISQAGEIEVQVCRLDAVLASVPQIDLLVMDTEGSEVRAMRGGVATLTKSRYFYVEYAPEQLLEQGNKPGEFIELVAGMFTSMYLPGGPPKFFPHKTYVSYLKGLPLRRGLLLNLLFSNESIPHPPLMDAAQQSGARDRAPA